MSACTANLILVYIQQRSHDVIEFNLTRQFPMSTSVYIVQERGADAGSKQHCFNATLYSAVVPEGSPNLGCCQNAKLPSKTTLFALTVQCKSLSLRLWSQLQL